MTEDIASIMSEGPNGETGNTEEFLQAGGWSLVSAEGGRQMEAGGLTSHSGVLPDDVYVDPFVLRAAAEEALGFTYAEVSAAYPNGRPTTDALQLRARIDARLLELSREKGLAVAKLAEVFGLGESTLDRALRRAKAAWVEPIVKNPAVVKPLMCFIEGTLDAKPRRRSHRGCPASMLPLPQYRDGTINLSDRAYARGL